MSKKIPWVNPKKGGKTGSKKFWKYFSAFSERDKEKEIIKKSLNLHLKLTVSPASKSVANSLKMQLRSLRNAYLQCGRRESGRYMGKVDFLF